MSDSYRDPERINQEIRATRSDMSDTINAIQERLSPNKLVDQAMNYFSSPNGKQMGQNLSNVVKENPLPVAMIGLGLSWLMLSSNSKSDQYRDYPERRFYDNADPSDRPYPPKRNFTTGYSRSDAAQPSLTERASDAASTAAEKASDAARNVQGSVSQAADATRHKISDAAGAVREKASDMADEFGNQYDYYRYQAQRGVQTALREQPLALVGVGLALGALLGAGLPSTRKEDEWMGETRDQLLDAAKETGQEQAKKAMSVANAAVEAAVDETDRQTEKTEKTKGKVKEAVDEAKDSAKHVANAATEAAKQEANKQGLTDKRESSKSKNS